MTMIMIMISNGLNLNVCRTSTTQRTFFCQAIKDYNALSQKSRNIREFKRNIKKDFSAYSSLFITSSSNSNSDSDSDSDSNSNSIIVLNTIKCR